jgi:signal transduction histidine kinase
VSSDPEAATELLGEAVGGVHEAIQQVRDLAHGIYPPLLVEAGLSEALRAAAVRSPVPVTVRVDGGGRLPADVEAAAYFCCLEALQNAAKHATGVSEVRVDVRHDADALHFTVTDDGPGFDPAAVPAGHGLRNMADRVGAVGGRVTWQAAAGRGTTVSGVVPLPGPQS